MTGFRVAAGGAQELFGVRPDLTTLGKVIGGGLPVGAYGGRADIMDHVAPVGPVYQAGTLSGNPLAVAAGLANLRKIRRENPYPKLEALGRRLAQGLEGANTRINRVGSMFTVFFTDRDVVDFATAKTCQTGRFNAYFHAMLGEGIYLPPSQFEAAFISTAHTEGDIDRTIQAARSILSS